MQRKIAFGLLMSLLIVALGLPISAQGKNDEEPFVMKVTDQGWVFYSEESQPWALTFEDYTKEDVAVAERKLAAIFAEKQTGTRPFPGGRYAATNEVSTTQLFLSQTQGFVFFELYSCLRIVRRLSFGKIEVRGETVRLIQEGGRAIQPDTGSPSTWGGFLAPTLVKVGFQGRDLLIADTRVKEFCDVVSGRSPFEGMPDSYMYSFLESIDGGGNRKKSQTSRPVLPAAFEGLVQPSIQGRVVSVGKPAVRHVPEERILVDLNEPLTIEAHDELVIPLTVNVGAGKGLKKGLKFYLCVAGKDASVEITWVGQNRSIALFKLDEYEYENKLGKNPDIQARLNWLRKANPFTVGAPVSTSFFDVPEPSESDSEEKLDQSR